MAEISSNSNGWVLGSTEDVSCLSPALLPLGQTLLFGSVLWFFISFSHRKPCAAEHSGGLHTACVETACSHPTVQLFLGSLGLSWG